MTAAAVAPGQISIGKRQLRLVFAGLIDVQDRMLFNRSYTTGHKAYRARSTVEIGNAIGWDDPAAHHVLYAGALDIAVGPRWYSTWPRQNSEWTSSGSIFDARMNWSYATSSRRCF